MFLELIYDTAPRWAPIKMVTGNMLKKYILFFI